MICPKCFNLVDEDASNCPICGADVNSLPDTFNTNSSQIDVNPVVTPDNSSATSSDIPNNNPNTNFDSINSTPHFDYNAALNNSFNNTNIPYYAPETITSREKAFAVLSYFGLLFLPGLFLGKTKYCKKHSYQGLVLWALSLIVDKVGNMFYNPTTTNLQDFLSSISPVTWLFVALSFVLFIIRIIGIISAAKGNNKEIFIITPIAKTIFKNKFN